MVYSYVKSVDRIKYHVTVVMTVMSSIGSLFDCWLTGIGPISVGGRSEL